LPGSYSPKDVIANLQGVGLLTAAFATGNSQLIAAGMRDRLHQPWRAEVCPLLPKLLPLAGREGIAGVALSGAGPAVLLLVVSESVAREAANRVQEVLSASEKHEIVLAELERDPAIVQVVF
jgi:homoserine kinase